MKIIFNHTLRSIKSNVGQFVVIIFTIAVVTTLFFASLTVGDLFYNFQLSNLSRLCGDTDVSIDGDIFSGERLNEFIEAHSAEVEYVDTYLRMSGLLNTDSSKDDAATSTIILVEATNIDSFLSRYKDKLSYYKGIKENTQYVYPAIWISRGLAEKNGYEIGTEVDIYLSLYQRFQTFTVTYIFEDEGVFANTTVYNVLTDFYAIGEKGLYTTAYIKLSKNADKDKFISELTEFMANPQLDIDYAVDYQYINNLVANNESLLNIALIFVLALVVFILFGAYKVVMQNRANELTVFKAAGATPLQTVLILLLEGIIYGAIGAIIGVVVGRFVMQLVVMNVIPNFTDAVVYEIKDYILSLLLGILISAFSALIPIIKLMKESVRRLNTGSVKVLKKISPYWLIPFAVIITACVLTIIFVPKLIVWFTVILILTVIAFVIVAAPYIISAVSRIFASNGIRKLASFSVKRNISAVTLSGMLGAIITFTFITVSIVNIIIDASTPYNSRFVSDYAVETVSDTVDMEEINRMIGETYGVTYSYLYRYEKFETTIDGKECGMYVYAVDSADGLERIASSLTAQEKEIFNNEEKSAIFSYDMLNRLGLKVGDKTKLDLGGKEYEFTVIAKDTNTTNTDRVVFINAKGCDYDFGETLILLGKRNDVSSADLYVELRDKLNEKKCYILEFDDWAYATSVGVNGIAQLLRALEILVGFVGLVGVMNMTISMILDRKREFEIYCSVGLDRKKYFGLLVCEGLTLSLTGGIIGMIFSLVINLLIPNFAKLIDRYISLNVFPLSIPIIIACVVVVYVIMYSVIGARYRIDKIKIERNIL